MFDEEKLMWAIEEQLRREQKELEETKKIVEKNYSVFDGLKKPDIINQVKLYVKLFPIEEEFRLAVYYLFRVAVEKGPDGSFIILDPIKAKALADTSQKAKLASMSETSLKVFCDLINDVNQRELTKPSSEIVFNRGVIARALNRAEEKQTGR